MKTLSTILYLSTLLAICYSCNHDNQNHEYQFLSIPDDVPEDRMLSSFGRQNIRIQAFYDLEWAIEEAASKIRDHMVPAVISYLQTTLKVNRLTRNLVLSAEQLKQSEVDFAPAYLMTEGVAADLIIFISGNLTNLAVMADSRAYILDERNNRPLVGKLNYNRFKNWEAMDDYTYELHLITTLHEFVHMLGFSKNLYSYFINPETERQMDFITRTGKVNDYNTLILRLEPLRIKLRAHFNCSVIDGAYLENQGTSQNVASHFERRVFYNELMTAAGIEDRRISEFSLAVLEGSGWYTPDYSMAEPIFWGKGAGCAFLQEKCIDENKKARFGEFFCDNRDELGCTFTGQSKGMCGPTIEQGRLIPSAMDYFRDQVPIADPFADNCPYFKTVNHLSCDNPKNQEVAVIPGEKYGAGSMCFSGTLSQGDELPYTSLYCMKKTCEEKAPGQFALGIEVDGSKYYCSDGESLKIKGYNGHLNCPTSINGYCSTKALKYCKRGCMGRGVCQNGECVCNPGFVGADCGKLFVPEKPKPTNTPDPENPKAKEKETPINQPITLIASKTESEDAPFVHPLAVVVGIVVISGVVFVATKIQRKEYEALDETGEEAADLKSPTSANTKDNNTKIIEIGPDEQDEIESQPNQEDIGRESSPNPNEETSEKAGNEAPAVGSGNQKAKYFEI